MRSRSALYLLLGVVVVALLLTPFATDLIDEPAEEATAPFVYAFIVIFCGAIGFAGWGVGYFKRGDTAIGLGRYIVGNLIVGVSLIFLLMFVWAATLQEQPFALCVAGFTPFVWFGWVMARWNHVKDPDGLAEIAQAAYQPKRDKYYNPLESKTLHGYGSEVSLPVTLAAGMHRLGYRFSGGGVRECEVFLSNVDDPSKRRIAVPESEYGAIAFAVPQDGRYVFEVDAVNDTGESLEWELTVERL